jgi:hypothetical protein
MRPTDLGPGTVAMAPQPHLRVNRHDFASPIGNAGHIAPWFD